MLVYEAGEECRFLRAARSPIKTFRDTRVRNATLYECTLATGARYMLALADIVLLSFSPSLTR
jgi:hypothetical protein